MIKIQVTQQDINQGIKQDCGKCPIALAAQRHFKTHDVFVGTWEMIIDGNKNYAHNGSWFIYSFDSRRNAVPQTIRIQEIFFND